MTSKNYIATELANVNVHEVNVLSIQVRDPNGLATKWLNITQEQFKEIERILTLGSNR